MKTCPTCHRTYKDDTLSFCLNDGSVLMSGAHDPEATQQIPAPQNTQPYGSTAQPSAYVGSQPVAAPAQSQHDGGTRPQERRGSGRLWLTIAGIAALLLLVAGVGVGIVLSQTDWFSAADNRNRSANTSATPPAPTPTPEPPVAERLGLVGNWKGTQNNGAASLTIVSGEGNAFSGTKYQGDNEVSFAGTIDPNTRRITMNETKVLKGPTYSNGKGWSLGTETGALSADGRRISGKGIDEYNRKAPYTWSYRKQ